MKEFSDISAADIDMSIEVPTLIDAATRAGVLLRVIGGFAIKMRCPSAKHRVDRQECSDVDFVTYNHMTQELTPVMESFHYLHNHYKQPLFEHAQGSFFELARSHQNLYKLYILSCLFLAQPLTQHSAQSELFYVV